eukprot:TRINITY_DN26816_c0_g1_i3.p1 TRINITY_DN26816_c0_g1~~TRINITY_DN26816_c0_g1_i3.p1  ORF type:complete len:162 (+),score=26.55 TRINITY_DN26816_c0_g1_i3:70-555(+)
MRQERRRAGALCGVALVACGSYWFAGLSFATAPYWRGHVGNVAASSSAEAGGRLCTAGLSGGTSPVTQVCACVLALGGAAVVVAGFAREASPLRRGCVAMKAGGKPDIEVRAMSAEEMEAKGMKRWPTWGSGVTKFDWQWAGDEEAYILGLGRFLRVAVGV